MARVLLHPAIDEQLDGLQDDIEERIRAKLERAGNNPDHFLKPLSGRPEYRLRIGDYRAIIDWDKSANELRVLEFGKRDSIYD